MTDRELLEYAAKAAGLPDTGQWTMGDFDVYGWNPLADDGDALRLAVALRISLDMFTYIVDATAGDVMCHEPWGDDHCAATRRAIVRAAAEIGKAMP